MTVPEHLRAEMGPCCMCGAGIGPSSFRDRASYREAHVTGLCQACQDLCFLGSSPDDLRAYPIHDGAIVAVRAPGHVAELALLPFRFVVPEDVTAARLVWEARFVTRAGPYQDQLDVRCELEPMCELLAGHQVCVTVHHSFTDAAVKEMVHGLHLLVGLDQAGLDAVAGVCCLPDGLALASLADEVPWPRAFGRSLRPLGTWWPIDTGPVSTVRALALMGHLFVDVGREGRRPLDYLLADRRALFEEHDDA